MPKDEPQFPGMSTSDIKHALGARKALEDGNDLTEKQIELLNKAGLSHRRNTEYITSQKERLKETLELLDARNKGEKDLGRIMEANNRLLEVEIENAKALAREQLKLTLEKQKEADATKEEGELAQKAYAAAKKHWELAEAAKKKEAWAILELEKMGQARGHYDDDHIKALKVEATLLGEISTEAAQAASDAAADLIRQRAISDAKVEAANATEDGNKGQVHTNRGMAQLLETTLGISENMETGLVGGLLGALKAGIPLGDILAGMEGTALSILTPFNLAKGLIEKIFQSTLAFMQEFDRLSSELRRNTGIIEKGFGGLEGSIVKVQRANLAMGVSMEEAFAAAGELSSQMASFNHMSDQSREKLLRVTTLMGEFGVSAGTTASIMNKLDKGLGMNAQQLERTSRQLMGLSKALKIPPKIIMEDFNQASSELMKYGNDMVEVFEGLEEQSKQTGLGMQELLGIAKQFDTFEDAGNAVGRLNAVLGGPYLNAIEMVYATEEERVKLLRESIKMGGTQFKNMERFEKQALMSAAGITDMSVAMQLFGGTDEEYRRHTMGMAEMKQRAQEAQAVTDKLKQIMMSFAIALGPLVDILAVVADALLFMLNPIGSLVGAMGGSDGAVHWLGQLTIGLYAFYAITKMKIPMALAKLNIGLVRIKMTTFQIVAVFGAAIAAFTMMQTLTENLTPAMGLLATAIGTAAMAMIAFKIAKTMGMAAPMMIAGIVGSAAALGGAMGVAKASAKGLQGGRESGPGGVYELAEGGPETVVPRQGTPQVVENRGMYALGEGDGVRTAGQTRGGGVGGMLTSLIAGGPLGVASDMAEITSLAVLHSIHKELSDLNDFVRTPSLDQTGDQPVVIKMDGKKVAESTIAHIQRNSSLTITKTV